MRGAGALPEDRVTIEAKYTQPVELWSLAPMGDRRAVLVVAHNALISSWMTQAIDGDAFAWPAHLLDNNGTAEVLVDPLTRTARPAAGPSPCPPLRP